MNAGREGAVRGLDNHGLTAARKRTVRLLAAIFLLVAGYQALSWTQPSAAFGVLERLTPNLVWRVKTDRPLVALSFDDGPDPEHTPKVLAILSQHGAHATFFVVGERALRHPDLIRRIREEGHEIGNHYFMDAAILGHSDADFLGYLDRTERAAGVAGPRKLFRPPGGVAWPGQLRLARSRGYTTVLGSAYPHDPMHPPAGYIRWLVKKNLAPGAIVILHDGIPDPSRSIEALPDILAAGRQGGLEFTTIGALMESGLAPAALPEAPRPENGFALQQGDRVVFYGDSITDHRHYTSFVETYVVTRFPRLDVKFVHSGWRGDGVGGGEGGTIDTRLARDVLAHKPTVVTVMLGMNDGGSRPFDPGRFEAYKAGYRHILETVRRGLPGARVTLLQPSPYDDVTRPPDFAGGYNEVLVRYGAFVRELAGGQDMAVADMNGPVVAALKRAHAADTAAAARLIPDRIHPGAPVSLVMAQALLQAWSAPALVTEVEIDVMRQVARVQVNTRVSEIAAGEWVSWKQSDQALPMPLDAADPLVALVLRSSDFMASVNRQPLRVLGLAPGHYALRIDGHPVGTFGSDQLSAGIDLAGLPTPMARQAAAVHALTLEHNALRWTRWRKIQVPREAVNSAELKETLQALDAQEAAVVARQRAAAQPRPRRYELGPAPP